MGINKFKDRNKTMLKKMFLSAALVIMSGNIVFAAAKKEKEPDLSSFHCFFSLSVSAVAPTVFK